MPTLIRYWGSNFKTPREGRRIAGYFSAALAAGWKCHLVCSRPSDDPQWATPVTESGVHIEYIPRPRGNFDRASVEHTRQLCRRVKADVLHCDNTHTTALLGAWLARVPVKVWTKHAMEPAFEAVRQPTLRQRLAPSLWLSIGLATRVLAISRAIERELLELGVPQRKLLVMALPIADREAAGVSRLEARISLECDPGDLVFSTIGRAVPVKGWDILLQAFRSVLDQLPEARLLLAGSTGARDERACFESLNRQAAMLNLGGRIRFLGHVTHIEPVLAASDAFVLPSRSEGYSLALLEALAAGLPVVSTRVGIAPEVVSDGQNGLLVEREDAGDLAGRMLAVARDPHLRERRDGTPAGIAGLPTAAEHAAALLKLYEDLLARA
jgi:glycosyltransferase involved in cell wall biosynthesis